MSTDTVIGGRDSAITAAAPLPTRVFAGLRRLSRWSGLVLATGVLLTGWLNRARLPIDAGEGVGYLLGVAGGSLMVFLLLYSGRKRIPLLRNLGPTRHWFRMHMTLGVIGPILILYHCNFQVGSLNSRIALYCTLLVALSGLVGRYLYAQIHQGLYGSKTSLRQLVATMQESAGAGEGNPGLTPGVRHKLAELSQSALDHPPSLLAGIISPARLSIRTRLLQLSMRRDIFAAIDARAEQSAVISEHRDRLRRLAADYLAARLGEIRRVALFGYFERLFALWHVVHVPFFILLVLSAIAHVLAVHMY